MHSFGPGFDSLHLHHFILAKSHLARRPRGPKSSIYNHLENPGESFSQIVLDYWPRRGILCPMKVSTIYQKGIKSSHDHTSSLLKKGSSNKKLGFKVSAKKWTGKRLYSLTLVERETCPTSCHHWDDCYGNNMPFAHRFSTEGLIPRLEQEIKELMLKHKEGIVIRLHVLGDFYSEEYVEFWQKMLLTHPKLCLFGYTARRGDNIASALWMLNKRFSERCVIRHSGNYEADIQSDTQGPFKEDWSYAAEESFTGASFDCPEQTGTLKDCASCGLCWITPKTVRFTTH